MTPFTAEQRKETFELLCSIRQQAGAEASPPLQHLLGCSVGNQTYCIVRDASGVPIGYFAWAKVIRETVARLYRSQELPAYSCEWHEGHITLLLDVCFLPGAPAQARQPFFEFVKAQRALAYGKGRKANLWLRRAGQRRCSPKHFA